MNQRNLFHRVGGHVFNTNIDEVLNWFWLKFNKQKEFKKAKRNAVIFMNKRFINYPIELNLNQLDQSISFKIINELIELTNKNNNSKTFYQFLKIILEKLYIQYILANIIQKFGIKI